MYRAGTLLMTLLGYLLLVGALISTVDAYARRKHVLVDGQLAEVRRREEYRYEVDLDSAGDYQLYWDVDPVVEKIVFRLEANVNKVDTLGFGFSDYGETAGADVVVMWTDFRGRHMFQDAHTDEKSVLDIDRSQDYSLDGIHFEDGRAVLSFHRVYDTCDDDDYLIDAGTTHIIFFSTPGVMRDIRGLNISELKTGMQRSQLLKSQLPDPAFPEDTKTFVTHVDAVPVPSDETTYWCKVKKLPDLPTKHHIIKWGGEISEMGRGIVHHLMVFHCKVPPGEKIRAFNGPCHAETRPKGLESCRQVIGAWAMGALPLSYPDEAGLPIGGPGFSRYVMMEVHYNNPEKIAGIVDSSGIRFYVTEQLRRYDAGTMELGLEYTDKYAIPPHQHRWNLDGHCTPDCTSAGLSEGGMKVFASQLHTHLTGKQVYTKHYRDGIELPELNRDDHYSPHYQEIRKLHRQVHVMPGDSLVTTCVDTTDDSSKAVVGGFQISDEMCVNYIHYYPKQELEVCKSSVTTYSLYSFFQFLRDYQGERTSPELGIVDNFHSIDWTPVNTELFRTFLDEAPLSMQCNQSNGDRFPGEWENNPIPKVQFPMPPTERPCLV